MPGYHNRKNKLYRMGGEMSTPRPMDKIIPYLKVGAGHRYPREFEEKMMRIQELFDAGQIDRRQMDEMVESATQGIEEYTGSDGRLRGSFIENPGKREAMDGRELMMNVGGKMKSMEVGGAIGGEEEELLAALKRANRASRDEKLPPKTADGFIIEGEDDPNENIIKDVIQASETTNRVGGFDPQIPIMRYVPRKPTMTKTIEEKPGDIIPPPPPPLPPPPKKDPEYKPTTKPTFTTDDGVLSSMPIFNRGIESTGMRGQGTTGNFRGVRSDIGQDGRLIERGEIVNVDDMPEYIREDPTFKNLLSQANETKYMQDIGKEEGLYATPGGQAAKDLADIMSGRITLDAYKERQNRASASFGYGGKMKFGVIKKRRGGR
jgi:hypothetical protein